ncbi:MAG: serine/threonine-protein kinase [Polyangiales bacterium]
MQRGTTIGGRYELLDPIGGGAFGEVWRATDTRLSHRNVAVKFLKPEFQQDAEMVSRFKLESEALSALQHPNVVGVFDRGTWDGTHFIVMEYIEGPTLKAWLQQQRSYGARPATGDLVELFADLCDAVAAGHSLAPPLGPLVHRDIKPGNVIVRYDHRGRPVPKVLDFGIAQLGGRRMTRTGAVLGSPNYMAPEQAAGMVRDVCPATDVFALGVVLVEMLTGQPRVDQGAPLWSTAQAGALSAQVLQRAGAVEADLTAALLRCLHPSPGGRYPSARELATDLRHWLTLRARGAGGSAAALDPTVVSDAPPVAPPLPPLPPVPPVPPVPPAPARYLRPLALTAHWLAAAAAVGVAGLATYQVVGHNDAALLLVAVIGTLVAAGAVVAALGLSLRLRNAHAVAVAVDALVGVAVAAAEWGDASALAAIPIALGLGALARAARERAP